MKQLPDWFPGTGFKKTGREWGNILTEMCEKPYTLVKQQMAEGKHKPSFLSRLLEQSKGDAEDTFVNKWSAASLYAAGADTVGFLNFPILGEV